MNTTLREALASTPTPIKAHPGFGHVSYTPSVGLSARPRAIHVLVYKGVEVSRGSKGDHLALLQHAGTKARWIAYAETKGA